MQSKLTLNNPSESNLVEYLKALKEFQLDSYFETAVLARAYELQYGVEVKLSSLSQITTMVSNRYVVEMLSKGSQILVSCKCPYPLPCKHQAAAILSLMAARTTI